MLDKIAKVLKPKNTSDNNNRSYDKSEHRVYTTKYEDLCQ